MVNMFPKCSEHFMKCFRICSRNFLDVFFDLCSEDVAENHSKNSFLSQAVQREVGEQGERVRWNFPKIFGVPELPWMSRKCPGKFLEISWKCPGNVHEISRNVPGNFQIFSVRFPKISRKFMDYYLNYCKFIYFFCCHFCWFTMWCHFHADNRTFKML